MTSQTFAESCRELMYELESSYKVLQVWLPSDKDIDDMGYEAVVEYVEDEIKRPDDRKIFLCEWKDYGYLRGMKIESLTCAKDEVAFLRILEDKKAFNKISLYNILLDRIGDLEEGIKILSGEIK